MTARVREGAETRGEVVNAVAAAGSAEAAQTKLDRLPLARINPFRLIGVLAGEVVELRRVLKVLTRRRHPWRTRQWVSSGFDEAKAQRIRGRTFRESLRQKTAGSVDWLRRLHRSHAPEAGPFSICMHRADASTVSYTEIEVSGRGLVMRHQAGAPCEKTTMKRVSVQLPR